MKNIAVVCKLMPLYRLGVFRELSKRHDGYFFTCFGDTKIQGGIEVIPWSFANKSSPQAINWVKTSNYFYVPERLLWQTGIVRRILFSKYKYFIFEGGTMHLPTWLFAGLCRISGKKALFWTHGFKGFDTGLKKVIRIFYFKLAHRLLLYGNFSRQLMIESGFDEKKLFVVFNSLDSTKQLELLKKTDKAQVEEEKGKIFKNPNLPTFIFIGRLVKGKKIFFLINAINDFYKKNDPVNCIIIGDGPEMNLIKKNISDNDLSDHVHLTGALYDEETICTYFSMADLMISPGNVGLNCMHSLIYGVPVLTHDNLQFHGPEVEAIIPGKTGLLFQYDNYQDLVKKIKEWKSMNLLKEDIKRNCQEMINDKYNPEEQALRIIDAINSL